MEKTTQQELMEFRKNREQLMMVGNQKQQLQAQSSALEAALNELKESKEKKVYKAIGNILILKDVGAVKKELSESTESLNLKIKTLQKQEDALIEKLNKLKSSIEKAMPAAGEAPTASAAGAEPAGATGEATIAKTEEKKK